MLGGGGSNILRGGKRSFECKTLVGNFVEEAYRPGAVNGSWDGGDKYASNTRRQMLDGVGIVTKPFGSGLKRPDDPKYNYSEIVGPDKTRDASSWISISQSTYCNSSKPTEFAAPRELKGRRMGEDELQEHHTRWTNEADDLVKARYVTETSAMLDPVVHPSFRKELCKPSPPSFK